MTQGKNTQENRPVISTEQEMLSAFQSQSRSEVAEVLKELFDEGKIYLIGDLSKDEIKLITRIYMVAEIKDIEIWKKGLAFFCKLLLSKDRKSRKEIIDAVRNNQPQQPNMFQRMNPFNSFGRRGF